MDVNAYAARLTGAKTAEMFYETPNLDRLTREGTAFSQAYACQLRTQTSLRANRRPSLVALFNDPTNTKAGYTRDTHYWHYPFNVAVIHPDDGQPLAPHSAIRSAGSDPRIPELSR